MSRRSLNVQGRCIGGLITFCGSAVFLDAGVQPRRTAGENELPKDQQRRQNLKAGWRHALRATERMSTSGPTSKTDCAENLPSVNRWPMNEHPRVQSRISVGRQCVRFREGEAPAEPRVSAVEWLGRRLAASPSHVDNHPRLHPLSMITLSE
jgi:hypothetical protein